MNGGLFSLPSVMDIYDVAEMFSRFAVDRGVAQRNVPSKWKVKIQQNGEALLLVMVQECRKMVLDHVLDVGPVAMSHIWIELEGPEEFVPPLSGTTRSLPTRYWYILPHQLDSRVVRALFGLVGVSAQSVRRVSLGGGAGTTRHGEVLEGPSADASYRWMEVSTLYPEPDIVTGSQCFFRKAGIRESMARARCESHFLGDGQVSLSVGPGSVLRSLGFGSSLKGVSNPVFVKRCRVNYRVGYF